MAYADSNKITREETKVLVASSLGTVFEWYDFFLYGTLAAVIAKQFFAKADPGTGLIFALLAFAAGFIVRPFGALVFGRLGDMIGRKYTFLVTILIMGLSTFIVGLLPNYDTIGIAAPIILIILRLLQGLALGGEYGGAAVYVAEHAPSGRRGEFTSWIQTTATGGLFLSLLVTLGTRNIVGEAAFADWGWRVPFLLGGILGPVGMYMRRTIQETPAYEKATKMAAPTAGASEESGWLLAGRAFGFTIVWTVCFYVLLNYMPTYTQKYLKLTPSAALWSNTIGLLVLLLAIPVMGALSDKVGRKPLLLACCIAFVVLPFPIFNYLLSGVSYGELIAVQMLFAVLISMFSGPGPAAIAEIFPTRSRSTWMTSGYALAVAIFGGFAPLISVWLIDQFNSPTAHVFYLIGAAIVSTIVIAGLKETAHEELA